MFKDFSKLNTFLVVVETKSFSKASKRLNISQPAVTQQIKLLEDGLKKRIIERKKSGIILTPEGEELRKIAVKLKKSIDLAEKEFLKLTGEKAPVQIGACTTVGEYVFPGLLNKIKEQVNSHLVVTIEHCSSLEERLKNKKIDIACLTAPTFNDGIIYKEWFEDEIVIFSNEKLPKFLSPDELNQYIWIYRKEDNQTRKITQEIIEGAGGNCENMFDDAQAIFNNATAVKNTVLKHSKDDKQVIALISRCVIEEELKNGLLFSSKIKGCDFTRKFYLAYLANRKDEEFVSSFSDFLLSL